jgi:histidyl-tRNA synthetase
MVSDILKSLDLNFDQFQIKYSNREIWDNLFKELKITKQQESLVLRAIDKKDRVGVEGIKKLLQEGRKDQSGDFMEGVGLDDNQTEQIINFIDSNIQSNQQLDEFKDYLSNYKEYPIKFI